MHPHPCLKTSLGTDAGSPATISDFTYLIEIVPTLGEISFLKFISLINNAAASQSCTPLKYKIESTDTRLTDALTINSSTSHSIIETTPTFTFSVDDTATNVVLNFGPIEDGELLGSHTLTLTVTMLNFP